MDKIELKEQLETISKLLEAVETKLLYIYAHISADVMDEENNDKE